MLSLEKGILVCKSKSTHWVKIWFYYKSEEQGARPGLLQPFGKQAESFLQKGNQNQFIQKQETGHSYLCNKIVDVHVLISVQLIILSFPHTNSPGDVFFNIIII